MNLLFPITTIVIFVCCSIVLSASETAVTMASRLRLHQLATKESNAKASLLLSMQEQMHTLISTILLANTCLFSGIAALATSIMGHFLGEWGIFVASILMGILMTLYLEVLPKVYAYQSPERVALFLVPMLKQMRRILRPITRLIDYIAHGTLSLLGVKVSSRETTIEDLQGAIDLHTGEGKIFHERAMLRSILDLSRVSVEEVMVHRKNILSFSIEVPPGELAQKMLDAPYTRIPLWKESPDNIIGVINSKDLARKLQASDPLVIEKIMQTPWFIPDTTTLFSQLQLFKERHSHQAFVVDEYGSLLGMITLEDILEEIVGEIIDEHDIQIPGVKATGSGEYLIQGSVTLRDLRRQYDWVFDGTESSTLAGLILEHTRSIPDMGTTLKINGFKMKVLRKHRHQITSIRLTPPKL